MRVRLLGCLLPCLLCCLPCWAAQPAGLIIVAHGDCLAVNEEGQSRALKRRSKIFAGDTLQTGAGAKLQLRFSDGGIISLREHTGFRVKEYRLDEHGNESKSFSTLIKGGFRAITGSIGKKKAENYRIDTPIATIGVRGTNFEAVLSDALYVAAWRGRVTVQNDGGEIALGEGAAFSYARIRAVDTPPKGLQQIPKDITDPQAAAPASTHGPSRQGAGGQVEPDGLQTLDGGKPDNETENASLGHMGEQSLINPDAFNNQLVENRLTDTDRLQLTQLGVVTAIGVDNFVLAGRSSNGADGRPIFVDYGLRPGDAGFADASISKVLRPGNAQVTGTSQANWTFQWGHWQSSVDAAAIVQTDAVDPLVTAPVLGSIYWFTAEAVKPLVQNLSGISSYANVIVVDGSGNDGAVGGLLFASLLDIDNGRMVGSMRFTTTGSSVWELSFDGRVVAQSVNFAALYGLYNFRSAVDANLFLLFTGDQAQGLGGAVQLFDRADPNNYLQGIFLVDNQVITEQRLTQAEKSRLTESGFAAYQYTGASVVHGGRASDGSAGNPIMTDNGFRLGQPGYTIAPYNAVLRRDGALLENLGENTTYAVNWGVWNGQSPNAPTISQVDPADPSIVESIDSNVYWTTFSPTSMDRFARFSGTAIYDNVLGFQGSDHNGSAVQSLSMQATVNFDNATLSGQLNVTATDNWQMQFDGGFSGPGLRADLSGTVNTGQASGSMQGAFVGNDGKAIGGAFGLQGVDDSAAHVEGTFLNECSSCP